MMDAAQAFAPIPEQLRNELIGEYRSIIENYAEHRWSPAELSGGKFCEIAYTILYGHAAGSYPARAAKPANFLDACRALEKNKHVPRSFQILIPRLLPSLYEVRNQRGVGHVGGDVDPNHMDATFVVSSCNWIMAELVRVLHQVSVDEAQELADALCERRIPLVWQGKNIKRVLDPNMILRDQVLVLLASSVGKSTAKNLQDWTEYKNPTRFFRIVKQMHTKRLIEFSEATETIEILPPGAALISQIVKRTTGRVGAS